MSAGLSTDMAQNAKNAMAAAASALGNKHESATSQTQSAIGSNIQIDTETPENLTALSRDTKNANQRVEKQDLQKVQERQEMAKVIGEISENAINIATYEEREKINKLGLEKFKLEEQEKALKGQAGNEQQLAAIKQQLTNVQAEITKTQGEIDRTYGIGSEKGMAIRAVTAALQAAAQNDTAGSLVALASPYLNQTIQEMTAGDTAKDKATNLMAHALLSAVEFQVTGKDPLTGAVAGVTGEATAEIIARAYGKPVSELTANEKENISTLSQLAGGLAAALTAKANGVSNQNGGGIALAVADAETSKRAVENNFSFIEMAKNPEYTTGLRVKAQADEIIKPAEDKPIKEMKNDPVGIIKSVANEVAPHYVSAGINAYKYSGKLALNLRSFDVFIGGSVSQVPIITTGGFSVNTEMGWITNFDHKERNNLPTSINNVLGGGCVSGSACMFGYCGGVGFTMPTKGSPKSYISTSVGIGAGYSIGTDAMFKVTNNSEK